MDEAEEGTKVGDVMGTCLRSQVAAGKESKVGSGDGEEDGRGNGGRGVRSPSSVL